MNAAAASRPSVDPRTEFVRCLKDSKRSPKLLADEKSRDGPNKLLASELHISPSRVGEFLNPNFFLGGKNAVKQYSEARWRKTVSGFAASVERALLWLKRAPVSGAEPLDTNLIVKSYWPKEKGHAPNFGEIYIQDAIDDGIKSARKDASEVAEVNIDLWVPNWGPLADAEKDKRTTGFYSEYGNAILWGLDPLRAKIDKDYKSLTDMLKLPARTIHEPKVAAMGLYNVLHRRLHGFDFVTFPIRFPLAAMIGSLNELPAETFSFKSLLQEDYRLRRVVVMHDVGHYVLCSMFPDTDQSGLRIKKLEPSSRLTVPELFLNELQHGEPITFIGDGMITFDLFANLLRKGYHVRPISQSSLFYPEFSFQGGIMFREEDRRFGELLVESQRQLFRSDWRVEHLLNTFMGTVVAWINRLQLVPRGLANWGNDAPLFLIRYDDVAEWTRTEDEARKIVATLSERITKLGNEWIGRLFRTLVDKTSTSNSLHSAQ